jgi:hypothetical protein
MKVACRRKLTKTVLIFFKFGLSNSFWYRCCAIRDGKLSFLRALDQVDAFSHHHAGVVLGNVELG